MRTMKRTFIAFVVGGAVLVPLTILGERLDVGSWVGTATVVLAMFVTSLVDREGFYGPRDPSPTDRQR